MAHVYVRYLGDLRGGQMIAKKIPGTGLYYQFQEPDELANSIYRKLNDNMANEAKLVFDYATKLFIEMYDIMTSEKEIK
jgi:heme oxygenase